MRRVSFSFFLIFLVFTFFSCHGKSEGRSKSGKIHVLATIFPAYDWAKNLAAGCDSVEVELLLKDGVDLHSYQPSAKDIVKISTADIFIYVGGESDAWVQKALENAKNESMTVINLMEILRNLVKKEEFVEGMTDFDSHDEPGFDEHIWLSLSNAIAVANEISGALIEKDEANAQIYTANLVSYMQALSSLKESYSGSFGEKTIIVCDRFPFRYLADEFGIKYYAAFSGCSAETEASFETIAFLSEKARELSASSVFVTESSDKKIARTVISESKNGEIPIITLDSMQSTTLRQAEKGADYLDIMRANLEALK